MKSDGIVSDLPVRPKHGQAEDLGITDRKLAFGAGATGLVNVIKVVLQLVVLPIMAKLLTPHEFGLYALAAPTVAFAVTLADGGLGVSLAREPETSTIVWSTAFWVLLLAGVCLAAGVSVWGLVLGALTHEPRLPALISLMSVSLILMTVTVPSGARLTRRGRLGTGAAADLFATSIGFVLAVLSAQRGAGAYSLAIQYVCGFAIRAIWINAAVFEMPKFEFQLSSLTSHLLIGSSLIGQKLVDFAERLSGGALLARLLGAASLGQYTFSTQVARFSTESAGNPTWAAIYVQSIRNGVRLTVPLYIQLSRFLSILLLPGSMIVAAAAPTLVALFLGAKWAPAAIVLQIVLPSYALNVISAQVGALLLAHGRNDVVLCSSAITSLGRILAIISGYWVGLTGVAYGVAFANLAYCVVIQVLANRVIDCRPRQLVGGLKGPFVAAVTGSAAYIGAASSFGAGVKSTLASILFAAFVSVVSLAIIDMKRLSTDWLSLRRLIKGGPS
jgi:O-antigen/teichoic acid export membrane protein